LTPSTQSGHNCSRECQQAAANTLDFGLSSWSRSSDARLDVFIIAVMTAACELRPMPAMGCEAACESMAAASRLRKVAEGRQYAATNEHR